MAILAHREVAGRTGVIHNESWIFPVDHLVDTRSENVEKRRRTGTSNESEPYIRLLVLKITMFIRKFAGMCSDFHDILIKFVIDPQVRSFVDFRVYVS